MDIMKNAIGFLISFVDEEIEVTDYIECEEFDVVDKKLLNENIIVVLNYEFVKKNRCEGSDTCKVSFTYRNDKNFISAVWIYKNTADGGWSIDDEGVTITPDDDNKIWHDAARSVASLISTKHEWPFL